MRYLAPSVLCVLLLGCDDRGIRSGPIGGAFGHGEAAASYTPADMRAIVARQRDRRPIVCTEPLPDVATAFSKALGAQLKGGDGGASGSLEGSYAASAAAMELAGRSTALLGLRDGLYRACEAYANGIIGDDSYALLLSRYGQLMVTLFLGQDLASAESRTTPVVTAPPPPSVPPVGGVATPQTPAQKPTADHATMTTGAPKLLAIDWIPVAALHKPTPHPGAKPPATTISASAPAMATAEAITRLQAGYFGLDATSNDALFVACVADGDPTRVDQRRNSFLPPVCIALQQFYVSVLPKMAAAGASR